MEKQISEVDKILIAAYLKNDQIKKAIDLGHEPGLETLKILSVKSKGLSLSNEEFEIYFTSFLKSKDEQKRYFHNLRLYLIRKSLFLYFFHEDIFKHLSESEKKSIKKKMLKHIRSLGPKNIELFEIALFKYNNIDSLANKDFIKKYSEIIDHQTIGYLYLMKGYIGIAKMYYELDGQPILKSDVDLVIGKLKHAGLIDRARQILCVTEDSSSRMQFLLTYLIKNHNDDSLARVIAANILELRKKNS